MELQKKAIRQTETTEKEKYTARGNEQFHDHLHNFYKISREYSLVIANLSGPPKKWGGNEVSKEAQRQNS